MTVEQDRLKSRDSWLEWGPYLSERAWGTVREDYSANGDAWNYLPHDHARSRAYRWSEDGIGGICDEQQRLCFALALWNGADPILKERMFGLTNNEGNHGEDVKEYYFFLDSTPTHSYMKMLYKYPQTAFPYADLIKENAQRSKTDVEYELIDTWIFDENRYFDIFIEYAKAGHDDILIRITAANRGPAAAPLTLLPTLWYRNTWGWGRDPRRPSVGLDKAGGIRAEHFMMKAYTLYAEGCEETLFTENETNCERLFGSPNAAPYVKDAFHACLIGGDQSAVNPDQTGTKAAAVYRRTIDGGASQVIRLRLHGGHSLDAPFADFDRVFDQRIKEADDYYAALLPTSLTEDRRNIERQALAGMLWSKQYYHYDVPMWLSGDPAQLAPPPERRNGRNASWVQFNAADIISMPDSWEYPWFAAWDLAFHCIPLALVDSEFAKNQLVLLLREWYMHPNGQVPAYEWNFSDVNPPVLAWAAWRVYKIDKKLHGKGDGAFLERVFHKLLLNFTWWVNRKDIQGHNVFEGGFLGLDNIGVFDRSAELPSGGYIQQSDATSWMAMFTLNMLTISLELSLDDPVYQDIATKFFEHFLYIAGAMNNIGGAHISLWNDTDEFFYDVLLRPDQEAVQIKIRSLVGLIPLMAVETLEPELLDKLPEFKTRMEWFLKNRPDLASLVSHWDVPGSGQRRLLALVRGHRMKALLRRALDPAEFLSDHGLRSISKYHRDHPYQLNINNMHYTVNYDPGDSQSGLFGGNSNWRGPVWFPINYLLIESLQKFQHYYSDDFKVECPVGSGQYLSLIEVADELSQRLIKLFERDVTDHRPCLGDNQLLQTDPYWRDVISFHEYFHGDSGLGLGASHQTGWTGLVAKLIQQQGEHAHKRA